MKINGYDVLVSAASWRAFCEKHDLEGMDAPPEYPCIVREETDSCEDPYLEYITAANVNKMAGALMRAAVQMKRLRKAKKVCGGGID